MRRLFSRLLPRLVASAAMLACAAAFASGLQVAPVSLTLKATQNADGLWLSNTGDNVVHAQVRVYRWTQEGDADKLEPTRGLVASPPMVELAAGERQLIRAIRLGAPPSGSAEEAYRLIIDELPVHDPNQKGLQYVLRYSVPVFVEPAGAPASAPQLQWALRRDGEKTLLEVSNTGGTHAQIADVAYTDAAGKRTDIARGLLGYVLPGVQMRWAVKVPAAALGEGSRWEAMINGKTDQSVSLAERPR
ncbi:MAG: Sigma-fimbriae chaperone protein [Burkholderiaceae bacterium]|jgi:fimbrial chaperone protein|nr:MAG: Sigma-fimbriae chaperone protein [Burkholderiaceae bacterium]